MSDVQGLQGNWNMIAMEMDGRKMPPATIAARIVVEGDRFTTVAMGATYEGRLEVQDAQHPKAFHLLFTERPEKGNRSLGIYELDGEPAARRARRSAGNCDARF